MFILENLKSEIWNLEGREFNYGLLRRELFEMKPRLSKLQNIETQTNRKNSQSGFFVCIPFFSRKKEGSGIGLSLSRQIMKLHRGRIDVETETGAGTTFILEF